MCWRRRSRRSIRGQPVILLTGFGDLMSGAGEKPEGVDLVVSKPFTLNSLRKAMTKALRLRGEGSVYLTPAHRQFLRPDAAKLG